LTSEGIVASHALNGTAFPRHCWYVLTEVPACI